MEKKKIFFISDYRNVTCEPTRDPTHWILKELDGQIGPKYIAQQTRR